MLTIEEVKTLTLKPNQTLVVKVSNMKSNDDKRHLKQCLSSYFPDNKVIVHDGFIDLSVIEDESNGRSDA